MHDNDIDYDTILSQYREDPFGYVDIHTRQTGQIHFHVNLEDDVEGITGQWHHIKGTKLFEINRERNNKPVFSPSKGVISFIRDDLDGQFVEAGERIITIRYPLKKREIIDQILRNVLTPFVAPERAKYFFSLEIQSRIDKFGQRSVSVKSGDEVLTMSLMKRDTPVYYKGEPGIIHSVYFKPGVSVDQGEPLLGICPPEKLPLIETIITRVKAEWTV
ncbi:MAG: hypothetical protein H8E41_12665 [Desulfobulbaceae bacterium]|uniref:Biotin attachment protein n=1 Tax=Candidatus Desulfobia pelagia TaxID=2841692 RepID=A0A8J6NFZ0_9BACT|nr:hypothetical protein [Candidatus Desulfobia pelagia]